MKERQGTRTKKQETKSKKQKIKQAVVASREAGNKNPKNKKPELASAFFFLIADG
ncbi:MAG: hypothetical protein ACTHLE_09290 [Agriterribacter sp.]